VVNDNAYRNFAELVLRHGEELGSKDALVICAVADDAVHVKESITFGEISRRIRITALQLNEAGFKPGDRIAVAIGVSLNLYILVLAIMMMGGVPVLINPGGGLANTYHSLKTAKLRGIISGKRIGAWRYLLPAMWRIGKMMTIDELHAVAVGDNGEGAARALVPFDPPAGQPALITYTSGSSGRPKGVNRTHAILISQYEALKAHFPPPAEQIDLPAFPVLTLYNLCCGVTTIMPIVNLKAVSEVEPRRILEQIKLFGVTTLSGAPAYLRKITDYCLAAGITLPQIRGLAVGGAPVSSRLAMQIRDVFPEAEAHILYGSSEAEPITSILVDEYLEDGEGIEQGYLVGKKADSVRLKILPLDAVESAVPEGEPVAGVRGEILVAGKHVCKNYYQNPEADSKYKLRDVEGEVWHRTGDVGFVDEDGRLWLVGRVEHVASGIFPFGMERVIEEIDGIGRVAVVGVDSGVVVFVEGGGLLEVEIRRVVKEVFGMEVLEVRRIDRLPVDMRHQSKVDYIALTAKR
jgi:acyl-CoA synthetase (AMP-forming)/AMP-acid ligase II